MFTGDAVGRRINLGGSRPLIDKQSLIEKQRMERLEREQLRVKHEACIKIASWWKGCRERRILGSEWTQQLHTCLAQQQYEFGLKILWACVLVGKNDLVIDNKGLIDYAICMASTHQTNLSLFLYLRSLLITATRDMVTRLVRNVSPTVISNCIQKIDTVRLFKKIDKVDIVDEILVGMYDIGLFVRTFVARFEVHADPIQESILQRLGEGPHDLSIQPCSLAHDNMVRSLATMALNQGIFSSWEKLAILIGKTRPCLTLEANELLAKTCLVNNRSVPKSVHFLHLVIFSNFQEDEIFEIVTTSNTCQVIAEILITELRIESHIFHPPSYIEHLVSSFTTLFSTVVRGVHSSSSSIVSTTTIEELFPLLNVFGYRRIVDNCATRYEALFVLIRAIYDKKFLKSETVWVIPESVHQIPPNLNSFEIIDRLRREEQDEEEEETDVPMSHQFTSAIFETMIEKMPHVVPFTDRVRILASALAEDKRNHYLSSRGLGFPQRSRAYVKRVRRDELLEDGMSIFSSSPESLKDILQIEFISTENTIEAGIDGGGLFKEFLHSWINTLMNPEFGLFQQLVNGRLSPNPNAYKTHANADKYFSALGRAVAKALYEMVLLETHLGESFLDRVVGRSYSLEQLSEIDESLYKNLKFVGTECENVEDLALTFAITGNDHETIDLVQNGSSIPVTDTNKIKYVLLSSWLYLARRLEKPAASFAAGFNDIVPISWLRMFSPREINLLISGEQRQGFDVDDLKSNVVYGGGYRSDSETITFFWEVVKEMDPKDQSMFLQFVTSSPRSPLLGFRVLHPKFAINRVPEPDRLPTASTCNNLFKLPDYKDKRVLREKLIFALYSHGGFDLS